MFWGNILQKENLHLPSVQIWNCLSLFVGVGVGVAADVDCCIKLKTFLIATNIFGLNSSRNET